MSTLVVPPETHTESEPSLLCMSTVVIVLKDSNVDFSVARLSLYCSSLVVSPRNDNVSVPLVASQFKVCTCVCSNNVFISSAEVRRYFI